MTVKLRASPATLLSPPDLAGKTFLVTGASAGIGRATAEALLAGGATVIGIARSPLAYRHPHLHSLRCDLARAAAITSLFKQVRALTPHLDGVVNVAGIDPKIALADGDEHKWREVVDLNLRGYYLVIRASAPLLRRGQGRSIVNVSSINYRLGVPKRSIYSAT